MAILVCPLSQVPTLAAARRPGRMVSLLDPMTPFPTANAGAAHLKLELHDIDLHADGMTAPQQRHMRDLLDFVSAWDRADPLLVHCWAGISRSTATAFITACVHNPQTDERVIARQLRAASATASPNKRLIALADAELGRMGRMVKAIAAIGRGPPWHEVGEAAPFELPSQFDPRQP